MHTRRLTQVLSAGPSVTRTLCTQQTQTRSSRVCMRRLAPLTQQQQQSSTSKRLYSTRPPVRGTERALSAATEEELPLEEITHYTPEAPLKSHAEVLAEVAETEPPAPARATRPPSEFQEFPDLMQYDPLMDSRQVLDFPPDKSNPYGGRVVVRNEYKSMDFGQTMFEEEMIRQGITIDNDYKFEATENIEEEMASEAYLPLPADKLRTLYKFPIFSRRITQQTSKGKIARIYTMMIVGDGNGLVGLGEGKAEESGPSYNKAFAQAVRNMDYVERFEKRTVWTEMETKMGSTRVILRPRPVGFGLRCNPNLHQVLKAAGIKDISAKVWGSRNPINVIKAAFRMLQAGNAPLGMGDGVGGKGRKLNSGHGARSASELERERGRKLVPLRT